MVAPIVPERAAATDESIDVVALVEQLRARDATQRRQALATLTSDNRISADKIMTARVVPPLLELLQTGNDNERGIATSLLLHLAKERDDACRTIANANVLALLLSFAVDADENLSTDATELVLLIAQLDDRYRTALFNANATPRLVQLRCRGTDAQRAVATRALQELVKGGDAIRRGMLELWVPAIRDGEGDEKELAMAAVAAITLEDAPVCRLFVAADMIPLLVGMLSNGIESETTFAAKVLGHLELADENAVSAAIELTNGIEPLVQLLTKGTYDQQGDAALVVAALARSGAKRREKLVRLRVVPPLVDMARNGDERLRLYAALALGSLIKSTAGRREMKELGGLRLLGKFKRSGTPLERIAARRAIAIDSSCCSIG